MTSMATKLFESDFLTIDIGSIMSKPKNSEGSDNKDKPASEDNQSSIEKTSQNKSKMTFEDWGKELQLRITRNREMSRESRLSEYDIETNFYEEFFNAKWDSACAKQLMLIGEPLRKAFRDFGFSYNPLLSFINQKWVRDNLIKTKLLNINTFKALSTAMREKLIAESEFLALRSYNIIYCRDLYNKSYSEIIKYLEAQRETLTVEGTKSYSAETQRKNSERFFKTTKKKSSVLHTKNKGDVKIKVKGEESEEVSPIDKSIPAVAYDVGTTLIPLSEVVPDYETNVDRKKPRNKKAIDNIVAKVKTPAEIFVVLQHFSVSVRDCGKARVGLKHPKLSKISSNDIVSATASMSNFIANLEFTKSDRDALVDRLISKLEEL